MKKSCDLLIVTLLAIVIAWNGYAIAASITIYVSPKGSYFSNFLFFVRSY